MDIINARKNSSKQINQQLVEKPPVQVESKATQVVPQDFKEDYNDKLKREKLKIYSNHDISFLLDLNNADVKPLHKKYESVLKAQLKVVKKEYEVNLKNQKTALIEEAIKSLQK